MGMKQVDMHMTVLVVLLLTFFSSVKASCPSLCNGHGVCNKYSKCECYKGYIGGDCSLMQCPFSAAWSDQAYAVDLAHAPTECSNRGVCDRQSGECTCMAGFVGGACERLECNMNCNDHGKCYTMHELAKETRNLNSVSYTYDTEFGSYGVWDANKISGCICDPGFTSYDCSLYTCVRGDDPQTLGQNNEVQLVKCIATAGSFTLWYNGLPSGDIPYDATAPTIKAALLKIKALTDVSVEFSIPTLKACQINTNVIKVTFTEQFGKQTPLVAMMDADMAAVGTISISADGVAQIMDFNGVYSSSVKGNKENEICAGRGKCAPADGLCTCFDSNGDTYGSSNGYGAAGTRGDCGFVSSGVVSTCPGQIQCSGHGLCDGSTYKCSCMKGWEGGDCSERSCPLGRSWFNYPSTDNKAHFTYTTCSDMGACDTTLGLCTCRENFYGQACDMMGCGGGLSTPCSMNGRCMSMRELAIWKQDNGEETLYTYGMNPNEPRTWDADRIHGCLCDPGYTGYDCSLRTCPKGDDPFTYDDHTEVQLLTCTATEGTFKLSFREEVTAPIAWNATANIIRDALLELPTMKAGGVIWQKSSRNSGEINLKVENGAQSEVVHTPIRVFFTKDMDMEPGVLQEVKPNKQEPEGDPVKYEHPHRLPAIDGNGVKMQSGAIVLPTRNVTSHFCNQENDQVMVISFDAIHGDVPGIVPITTDLGNLVGIVVNPGTISVYEDGATVLSTTSIRGTTENIECNGRGICQRDTGTCACFHDWASSDGMGNGGYVGDCGFKHDTKHGGSSSSWSDGANSGLMNPDPLNLRTN